MVGVGNKLNHWLSLLFVIKETPRSRGYRMGGLEDLWKDKSHLSLRKGDATANVRMDCLNKKAIDDYFSLLKDVLIQNELMNLPGQIYNVDETGMPLNNKVPKIVTRRGHKKSSMPHIWEQKSNHSIGCASATGHALPPFVIFDAKSLNAEWTRGTTYGLSSKGWVDTELFKSWLTDHLLKYAVGARPLLVLLDGHSSHYQPELIRFAV